MFHDTPFCGPFNLKNLCDLIMVCFSVYNELEVNTLIAVVI